VEGYTFKSVPNLLWHSGRFWMDNKEVKQVNNNGSLSLLLYGSSKKSIKKLRKEAVKSLITIEEEKLPF
jgi:hypothetical protein